MTVMTRDSPRNCLTSWDRLAPMTFRILTSLALFKDRAVERFMKLKQAIKRRRTATKEKTYT